MRSRTDPDLPGKCRACFLPERLCLCSETPKIVTQTRFLVIRQWREQMKTTNTARLAALALPNLTMAPYGAPGAPLDENLISKDAWLLFPDGSSRELPHPPPREIIVVDGSWNQARRIVHHVPALRTLPRLALPPPKEGVRRLRRPPRESGMSTIEAIAQALLILEGREKAAPLEALHQLHTDRVLSCRGE